ncbi:MAG TPA: IPT/TIG domain-containing protein [Acidimicrobiales bacterium]|nr:IPT/TIG domain-containing protein [Acidimicrobiales bacterium]
MRTEVPVAGRRLWAVPLGLAVIGALLLGNAPARGAYPGANGRIAFESNRDGNLEIYSMNPDGSDQVNLTRDPAEDTDPVWSPNGTRIAFVKASEGHRNIYVMNADGSGQTNLTPGPVTTGQGNEGTNPTWSPDGTRIAYASSQGEIWVMNADGSGKTNLTNTPATVAVEIEPAWSPDGTRIAYVRAFDIWVMNADGSGQRPLTTTTGAQQAERAPDWSPDGSRIVYQKVGAVWVMNADGTGQMQVVPNSVLPAWSPDGTRIVFSSSSFGAQNGPDIFTANADGTNVTRLPTAPNFTDTDPNWGTAAAPPPTTTTTLAPTTTTTLPPTTTTTVPPTTTTTVPPTTTTTTVPPTTTTVPPTTTTLPPTTTTTLPPTTTTTAPTTTTTVPPATTTTTAPTTTVPPTTTTLPPATTTTTVPATTTTTTRPPPGPEPRIESIRPSRGPDVGGTQVCVSGRNLAGGTVLLDGIPVPTTQERGGREARLCFVTPPHAPGDAQITVRTPNGNVSNPVRFRFEATPPPVIERIRPSRGPDVGGTTVCLTGSNLDQGTVHVDGNPVPTSQTGGPRGTSLCFVTPPHAPGDAQITVRTPNGNVSNTVRFRFEATPPPVIERIRPSSGPDVGGTEVCLTGRNLDQGTVHVDGAPVPTTQQRGGRDASLCFTTPPHAPGDARITVHTPNGNVSNPVRFRYEATPPPEIDRIRPSSGPDVGGTDVCLTGSNLDQGTVLVDGNPVPTTERGGPKEPSLCFLTPPHAPGDARITVRTPNGNVSNPVRFRYEATPPPVIERLSPASGPEAGGTLVCVRGENLSQGVVHIDGSPVPTTQRGGGGREAVALCFTTPPHAVGEVTITVRTPNGNVSNPVRFRYEQNRRPR